MSALEQMDPAQHYDHTLRFQVKSRSDPHATYMCELDAYGGNGRCDCMDFATRKEPLLARRITAEQAVAQGLAKVPKSGRISDALRCGHLVDARDQLATAVIRTLVYAEKKNATKAQR